MAMLQTLAYYIIMFVAHYEKLCEKTVRNDLAYYLVEFDITITGCIVVAMIETH
jgi:hypothetical protein